MSEVIVLFDGSQQSSQGSQNIIIETGRHPDQLNTRHTINVVVNNSKRERQKKYRERNRDKLKHREAERRKRIQSSQSIIGPSTSSNSNIMEVNNEEPVTAISSTLQNKRDRQKRYREKNREKLSQREAERRRRLQNAESIIELYTSPNIENREIITEPIIIIDEVSTNSRNLTGLGEMEQEVFDISQQILREEYVISDTVKVIPTPGHTLSDVTVLVKSNKSELVAIAGDLFEKYEDIEDPNIWLEAGSEDKVQQARNRSKIADTADWIIPGHGAKFQVTEELRKTLRKQIK
ncbi:Uncharacterized protein C03F11.2 [Papilio machaon]|uniref:Uncharacterized protein C03F11.2 n=1 Tax=Papilio machaon TaxID=76193 RepID=A0A194RKY3_PAPMA|nr:Uncharacterized protein C03F11.2 [Papilio machaon]